MTNFVLCFIVSFIATFFASLAGGGCGYLLLPLLISLDIPFVNSLACLKIALLAMGIGSGLRYMRENLIIWQVFRWTILSGVPFVILGVFCADSLPGPLMKKCLGIFILGLVLFSLFRKQSTESPETKTEVTIKPWHYGVLALIGLYNGSLSAGTGTFLTFFYRGAFSLNQLQAMAIVLSANVIFWNGSAALMHIVLGNVWWSYTPPLIIGALAGSYTGAHVGIKKGNLFVYRIFLAFAFFSGLVCLL